VLRHNFTFQVFQNLLDCLLLFILFVCEVLLQGIVNFLKFLLGLCLVLLKVVLLFELRPQFHLVHEVRENVRCQLESLAQILSLVSLLKVVFVRLYKEGVRVHILGKTHTGEQLVNKGVNIICLGEVAIEQLEVSDKPFLWSQDEKFF
jgi:hypothetical protein